MSKRAIKILKKDKAENLPPSIVFAKDETINQSGIAKTINNWIAERRANSRAQEVAAVNRIKAWTATV